MREYLDGDVIRQYITDTDIIKYAPISTETDPVLVTYLEPYGLVLNGAEIYLDGILTRYGLDEYTDMSQVTKYIQMLLGAYVTYRMAVDRIGNNPHQNYTDLQYDLYKAKIEQLRQDWKDLEIGITEESLTGEPPVNNPETSNNTILLFRR